MEKVYEKLLQQLAQMTPEQKAEEWEALKCFNEMGPEVVDYLRTIVGIIDGNSPTVAKVTNTCPSYSNSEYYLAA